MSTHLKWCTCDRCIHTRCESCQSPQHLALEADLTSGTLRFTDPEQLTALVMIARDVLSKRFSIRAKQWQTLNALANIVLPSDSV